MYQLGSLCKKGLRGPDRLVLSYISTFFYPTFCKSPHKPLLVVQKEPALFKRLLFPPFTNDVLPPNAQWGSKISQLYSTTFCMYVQVILFEIDCAIFFTNLHELLCQFISYCVNSGKFMNNSWISCQVMADIKKVYDDLIIINL